MDWDERYTLLLPPEQVDFIQAESAVRFKRLVASIVQTAKDTPDGAFVKQHPEHVRDTLPWVSHVYKFLNALQQYDLQDVADLYHAVMHMVLVTKESHTAHSTWVTCATSILRIYRNYLSSVVTLDFNVYWEYLMSMIEDNKTFQLDGQSRLGRLAAATILCKMARSLFEPSAAQTVWERLCPQMQQPLSAEYLEAASLLLVFFPHRAIAVDQTLPWNAWANKAMSIWDTSSRNSFWDNIWACFIARLAKHDTYNVIDWPTILSRISEKAIWFFNVPIGQGGRGGHSNVIQPKFPLDVVANRCSNSSYAFPPCGFLAKILVYTLRSDDLDKPLEVSGKSLGRMNALAVMQTLSTLLEHYFHASNNGSWSDQLASFLSAFSHYLLRRRLPFETSEQWRGSPSTRLDTSKLAPFAEALITLAMPAMYHKSKPLRSAALETLTNMVYLAPNRVLGTVHRRFYEAMEASNSVHQLSSAIRTLAGVVRPMLLYGLHPEPDAMDTAECVSPHQYACQELGRAMVLILPGIDANDQPKTEATISLYLSVFCNCVAFTGEDLPRKEGEIVLELGFYTEDFVLELLRRVFELIDALETSTSAADGTLSAIQMQCVSSSWLGDYHKFDPMMGELFRKMPEELVPSAVAKVKAFVLALVEPQQGADAMTILKWASTRSPDACMKGILLPLMELVKEDVSGLTGVTTPSKTLAKRIHTRLVLLVAIIKGVTELPETLYHSLTELSLSASRVADPDTCSASSYLLSTVLHCLLDDKIDSMALHAKSADSSIPAGVPGSINSAVARWVSRDAAESRGLAWLSVTHANVMLGRNLMERVVKEMRGEIDSMIADGTVADSAHASRLRLHRAQHFLLVVSAIVDFGECGQMSADNRVWSRSDDDNIQLCVSRHEAWEGCTLADDTMEAALQIAASTDAGNTWSLSVVAVEMQRASGANLSTSAAMLPGARVKMRERIFNESCVADILLGLPPASLGRHDRQPFWLAEKLIVWAMANRKALQGTSPWPSSRQPELKPHQLHPRILKCCSVLLQLGFQRYMSVSKKASRALAQYIRMSSGLLRCMVPTMVASAALLTCDARVGPMMATDSAIDASFVMETSESVVSGILQDQVARMAEMIRDGAADSGAGHDVLGAAVDNGTPDEGECTSENKHIVLSGLAMMSGMPGTLGFLMALDPAVLVAQYLACVVLQGHSLLDVKPAVNRFLMSFSVSFTLPLFTKSGTAMPPPARMLTRLFLTALSGDILHWRSAVMAHVWFALLAPMSADPELTEEVIKLQLKLVVSSQMLVVKDVLLSSIVQLMDMSLLSSTDTDWQRRVFAAVRKAASDATWRQGLVEAIDSLHAVDKPTADRKFMQQLRHTPEAAIMMLMRTGITLRRHLRGSLHQSYEPRMSEAAPAGGGPAPGYLANLAYFWQCLGQIAPADMMAIVKEPLLQWNDLPPEKEALEQTMEYTTMEICNGCIASAAIFKDEDSSGEQPAFTPWMADLIQTRWNIASTSKNAIWANSLGRSLRVIANNAAEALQPDAAEKNKDAVGQLVAVTKFFCCLTEGWTGSGISDCKHGFLLQCCLDHLTQVQCMHPCSATQQALEQVLARCLAVISGGRLHPMQVVRRASSRLIPPYVAICRSQSPCPLLSSAHDPSSQSMLSLVESVFTTANDALEDAASAAPTSHNNTEGALCLASTSTLAHWEASIGFAASLASDLCGQGTLQHLFPDLVLQALSWAIAAQGLQHPDLQSTIGYVRSAVSSVQAVRVDREHTAEFVALVVKGVEQPAWQSRGIALALLQGAWFRNFFTLADADVQGIIDACQCCLQDEKLEIRDVAAANLSGLLTVLPEAATARLREDILQDADLLFPRKRAPKGKAIGSVLVAKHHACVLGLRSLLQSSPYEIRHWMDRVLLAIVRASHFPVPVKTTAVKALGDFRKTHENTNSRPLKERLLPDTWERIIDVALQSSYFA